MALYTDYTGIETTNTDASAINNAIRNILMTPRGSLPGKPTFGSDLYKVLFSQIDDVTKQIMKRYITEALGYWETRIVIDNVEIQEVPEYNKIITTINYTYRDKGLDVNEQISLSLVQ